MAETGTGQSGTAEGQHSPSVRSLVAAAVSFVLFLLVLNFAAEALAFTPSVPTAYEVPRNPYFRRGWPAYTEAPSPRPPGKTVIVISNSQGFMREVADGEQSYSARLRDLLSGRDDGPWHVLNWSIPGGGMPEMTVLAARTQPHAPDIVVLVTFLGNLSQDAVRGPLTSGISDVSLLPAIAEVRELLSPTFREEFGIGGLSAWSDFRSGFGRFRLRTVDGRGQAWTWRAGAVPLPPCDIELPVQTSWGARSDWILKEFAATLHRAAPAARLLVVQMPLARCGWDEAIWDHIEAAPTRMAQALASEERTTVLNPIDLLPTSSFFTPTHMTPAGHERFAHWLFDAISRLDG